MQTAWPERTPAYGGAGEITGQRRGSESEELGQAGKQLQAFPHCEFSELLVGSCAVSPSGEEVPSYLTRILFPGRGKCIAKTLRRYQVEWQRQKKCRA